jgi:hypothetical protein
MEKNNEFQKYAPAPYTHAKSAIEKAQKKSGYKYIKSKMVKKGLSTYIEVYLVKDPNQATM